MIHESFSKINFNDLYYSICIQIIKKLGTENKEQKQNVKENNDLRFTIIIIY